MERFFLSLKMERIWQRDYANHEEAKSDIADYISGFPNPVRLSLSSNFGLRNVFESIARGLRVHVKHECDSVTSLCGHVGVRILGATMTREGVLRQGTSLRAPYWGG